MFNRMVHAESFFTNGPVKDEITGKIIGHSDGKGKITWVKRPTYKPGKASALRITERNRI